MSTDNLKVKNFVIDDGDFSKKLINISNLNINKSNSEMCNQFILNTDTNQFRDENMYNNINLDNNALNYNSQNVDISDSIHNCNDKHKRVLINNINKTEKKNYFPSDISNPIKFPNNENHSNDTHSQKKILKDKKFKFDNQFNNGLHKK